MAIISYLNVEDVIRAAPDRLHNLDWVKTWLDTVSNYKDQPIQHYHLIMACKYIKEREIGDRCPRCGEYIDDSDWDFCAYCGLDLERRLDLFEEDEIQIMKAYKYITGENMPLIEQKQIKRSIYLKVWTKNEKKLS